MENMTLYYIYMFQGILSHSLSNQAFAILLC